MKTAIVTGGTSGLGLAAAQALAEKGLRVYALSRHGAPVPGVTSLACDITDADAVERTIASIEAEAGRIDLVVNNAGFGISGAVECTTPEEARRLFDVDFFGVVNVNHAVLPRMRRAGGGRIVHVSSVAAPVAIPFQAYYSAAKAAINELLDGAKLPKMDALKKQRRELAEKKKALYAEYRKAQADMRQAVAVKANIDHLLGVTDGRENKAQER